MYEDSHLVESEYRLYYSLSSILAGQSGIGLATAASPNARTEKDLVVTSLNDNSRQTNVIDPTVVTARKEGTGKTTGAPSFLPA